jgi:hypothetical protein
LFECDAAKINIQPALVQGDISLDCRIQALLEGPYPVLRMDKRKKQAGCSDEHCFFSHFSRSYFSG